MESEEGKDQVSIEYLRGIMAGEGEEEESLDRLLEENVVFNQDELNQATLSPELLNIITTQTAIREAMGRIAVCVITVIMFSSSGERVA